MRWHPDLPDIPIIKPKQIEDIEQMDRVALDSMPQVEIQEKVDELAHAVAVAYKKQNPKGSEEECQSVVSIALTAVGSALQGHLGAALIAQSEKASVHAAKVAYSVTDEI